MAFCSKCGEELSGAKKFCSYCGFPVPIDLEGDTSSEFEGEALDEIAEAEVVQTAEVPAGAILVNKRCNDCGESCETKCFFCHTYICDRHSDNMQILADKAKFGDVVVACGNCSDAKSTKQPTEAESKEMGFFFKIKPYHQWTILERK